ncbi:unnamed protein product, partial [Chrysoparadoxa australica]
MHRHHLRGTRRTVLAPSLETKVGEGIALDTMRSPPPEAGQDCSKVFVRRRPHCDVPSPQSQEESIEASPSPLPGSKF